MSVRDTRPNTAGRDGDVQDACSSIADGSQMKQLELPIADWTTCGTPGPVLILGGVFQSATFWQFSQLMQPPKIVLGLRELHSIQDASQRPWSQANQERPRREPEYATQANGDLRKQLGVRAPCQAMPCRPEISGKFPARTAVPFLPFATRTKASPQASRTAVIEICIGALRRRLHGSGFACF